MPANRKNLNWFEITDFTPGVFGETAIGGQQVLIPQNGFSRMQCYYPLKQGGIRAFYATAGSMTCTGRTSGAHGSNNESPIGLFAHGAQGGDNLILVTHNANDHKDRVYYFSTACTTTTWAVKDSSAANSSDSISEPDFQFFFDGSIYYYAMVLRGQDKGLYTITYDPTCSSDSDVDDDGYFQNISPPAGAGNFTGPLGINGARLLVGDGTVGSKLWWSDPGALTFTETVSVPSTLVYPNDVGAGLRCIVSMQPDQFLVGRGGASWVQFSGDIGTTGTSRAMSQDYTVGAGFQQPARVPGGIAFINDGGYIYVTDGNTFENISQQLPAFASNLLGANDGVTSVAGPGHLTWLNGFLFAPDGKVMHWETKSWFTLEDSTAQTAATPQYLYYTIREAGTPVNYINMLQGTGAARATVGNFQTAPFADKDGRNVEIREVQLFFQAYTDGTNITCDIYNGEDEFVVSRIPEGGNAFDAGRAEARFLFNYPKDDYLSVRICTDGNGGEAPTIERLRIGFGQNNDILGI